MEENNIIPISYEVKYNIYRDFQRLKRQTADYYSFKSNSKKQASIINYRVKFHKIITELLLQNIENYLDIIDYKRLIHYYSDVERIKTINTMNELTLITTMLIKKMNITNIEFIKNEDFEYQNLEDGNNENYKEVPET